jgi:hypothetical protein
MIALGVRSDQAVSPATPHSMLLTLSTRSLQFVKRDKVPLAPHDAPDYVAEVLGIKGLNVNAPFLKGMAVKDLERLRDRADRARCPILVLVEERILDFRASAAESTERVGRLGLAASKLGAPSVAIELASIPESDDGFIEFAASVKRALASLDRFDTHLLIRPGTGTAGDPARIADLIKKIGGFRIGSMPTFAHAASSKDPVDALRRLAPYAQAMEATVKAFTKSGAHEAWDLARLFGAAEAAGYQSTMCIDYGAKTDPVGNIDRARDLLAALIDPVDMTEEAEDAVEEAD